MRVRTRVRVRARVRVRGHGRQTESDLGERLVGARVLHERAERVAHVGGGGAGAQQCRLARPQHTQDSTHQAARSGVHSGVDQGGPRRERDPRVGGGVEAGTARRAAEHAADRPDERALRLLQLLRLALRVVLDAARGSTCSCGIGGCRRSRLTDDDALAVEAQCRGAVQCT